MQDSSVIPVLFVYPPPVSVLPTSLADVNKSQSQRVAVLTCNNPQISNFREEWRVIQDRALQLSQLEM